MSNRDSLSWLYPELQLSAFGNRGYPSIPVGCQRKHINDASVDDVIERANEEIQRLERHIKLAEEQMKKDKAALARWRSLVNKTKDG